MTLLFANVITANVYAGPQPATPTSGVTTFNSFPATYTEYARTTTGASGFTATNLAGWDISVFTTTGSDPFIISSENWGASSDGAFLYLGLDSSGTQTITSVRFASNDGKLFDFNAIDLAYDSSTNASAISFTFTGYLDSSPVSGATLTTSTYAAIGNSGTWQRAISFTGNTNFQGVDEVRITPSGAVLGLLYLDNINATDFRDAATAPALTATGGMPTFTQGSGSGVDLFSSVSAATNDSGQTFASTVFTVSNVTDLTEYLVISGTDVALTDGVSGTISGVGSYSVTVAGGAATVILSGMTQAEADMDTLIDGITYKNSAASVTAGSRVVTLVSVTDSGGSNNSATVNLTATVTVSGGGSATPVGQMACTFGTYGYGMGSAGSFDHTPKAIAVYPSSAGANAGKVVVAGIYGSSTLDIVVMRFNTDGTPDTSFSSDGMVTLDVFGAEIIGGMGIDANGSIVIVGRGFDGNTRLIVVRLTAAGELDTTFSGDGKFIENVLPDGDNCGGDCQVYYDMTFQADNKIIVVGSSGHFPNRQTMVVRLTTAGVMDTTFDGDGKKHFYVGASAGSSAGHAIKLDSSGAIYILGGDKNGTLYTTYLAKLTTSGAFDTTFDDDGKMWLTIANAETWPSDLQILSNGQLAFLTISTDGGAQKPQTSLGLLNSDGSFDTTFGGDGIASVHLNKGIFEDTGGRFVVQSDGKFVIASDTAIASRGYMALARFNTDGTLDPTFGTDGIKRLVMPHASLVGSQSLALMNDGHLAVLGGLWDSDYQKKLVVVKFLTADVPMSYGFSLALQQSRNLPIGYEREALDLFLCMDGQLAPLDATAFTFQTTGTTDPADLAAAALYHTTANVFTTTTPVGTVIPTPTGTLSFTDTQPLNPEFNHFWLAYSVAGTATISNVVDGQATAVTVDAIAHTPAITAPVGSRTLVDPLASKLIWTNDYSALPYGRVMQSDTAVTTGTLLLDTITAGAVSQYGVAIDPTHEQLYFVQSDNTIARTTLDGAFHHELLAFTNIYDPATLQAGLAVDPVNNYLYYTTDRAGGAIYRTDLAANSTITVATGQDYVASIAIDTTNGKLYWMQRDNGTSDGALRQAGLDGSGVTTLDTFTGLYPGGIALDVEQNKLYYTDGYGYNLKQADLDGGNKSNLLTGLSDAPGALAVDTDKAILYVQGLDVMGLYSVPIASPVFNPIENVLLGYEAALLFKPAQSAQSVLTPTITATGAAITFTQGSATGVDLFSSVSAATNDSGQFFTGAVFTVSNVTDITEYLVISGTDVALTDGVSGTISGVGGYSVIVASGTTTVTLSGMTQAEADMDTLIDGITYKNSANPATTGERVITLVSVTDNGSSNNRATLNLAATVMVSSGGTDPAVGQMYCSFGTYGYGIGSAGSSDHTPNAIAVYPASAGANAGKIVVAGSYNDDIIVMRFTTAGTLDPSFSSDGIATADLFGTDLVGDMGIDTNGSIVVIGSGFSGGSRQLIVARFEADGDLDTTFSGDGKYSANLLPDSDSCGGDCQLYNGVALQTDNKIVIVGASGYNRQTIAIRLTTAGALDSTFNGDGKMSFYVGASAGSSYGRAVKIDSNGAIYILGGDQNGAIYPSYLAKLTTSGNLDTTFDSDGKVWITVAGADTTPSDLLLLANGQFVVMVTSKDGGAQKKQSSLIRLNSNGTFDTSFGGGDGIASAHLYTELSDDYNGKLVQQSDGKFVVVSDTNVYSKGYMALARFAEDGTLDPTFGSDGIKRLRLPYIFLNGSQSMALMNDGHVAVLGTAITSDGKKKLAVVKFLTSAIPTSYGFSLAMQSTTGVPRGYERDALDLVVCMNGQQSPFTANTVTFNTTGTTDPSEVTAATLYHTTSSVFTTTTPIGTPLASPNGTLHFTPTQQLAPELNYFWLAYTLKPTAVISNVIDGQVTALTVNSTNYTPDITSPTGSRRIFDLQPAMLIWPNDQRTSTKGMTVRAAPDGSNIAALLDTSFYKFLQQSIAFDPVGEQLYFVQVANNTLVRTTLDGAFYTDLLPLNDIYNPETFYSYSLAVDPVNRKLYYATTLNNGTLYRADLDGRNATAVATNQNFVRSIAVDPTNSKLYWMAYNTSSGDGALWRAGLDGSSPTSLDTFTGNLAWGLALDVADNKLYYGGGSSNRIVQADLDGSNKTNLITGITDRPGAIALDTDNNILYWQGTQQGSLHSAAVASPSITNTLATGGLGRFGLIFKPAQTTQTVLTPTITATGAAITFTQGSATGVDLFSSVSAATNDSSQTFASAVFTVSNVTDITEYLVISGTDVALTDGISGTIGGVGSYSVTVTGGAATVTLSSMTQSDGDMGALIDGMSYRNSANPVTTGERVITLVSVTDSGSSNNSATISLVATVTVQVPEPAIYYLSADGNGSAVGVTDALNRIKPDGTGAAVIKSSIHPQPGDLALDLANQRAFFLGGTSTVPGLFGLDLTTNTVFTITTLAQQPAYGGLAYDPVADDLYYLSSDGNGNGLGAGDALHRIKPDGTGGTVLKSSINAGPGDLALDLANQRVFFLGATSIKPGVYSFDLTTNTVFTITTLSQAIAYSGLAYDAVHDFLYYFSTNGNGSTLGTEDALHRIKPDGTGDTVIKSSIHLGPGDLTLDIPNQRAFYLGAVPINPGVFGINLATSDVFTLTTLPTNPAHGGIVYNDNSIPTFDGSNSAPADDATSVAPSAPLALRFSEPVIKGITGTIIIRDVTANSVLETLAYTDTQIAGWTTNTLTITPSANLPTGHVIAVQWSFGAIRDYYDNYVVANATDSTYNFTIGAASDADLAVAKTGNGTGTVTSLPTGIDCGITCTATFNGGTVVTLTATADVGSFFAGWTGACSGTGNCTVTLSANEAVTATFQIIESTQPYTSITGKAGTLHAVGGYLSPITVKAAPSGLPRGIKMPLGQLSFTITGTVPGGTIQLSLYADSSLNVSNYYKRHRITNAWTNIATAVGVANGTTTRVDFSLTDGGPYDADGVANGTIVDPGGVGANFLAPLVRENTLFVATVEPLTDTVTVGAPTYAIAGGADAALFTMDASTGLLQFINAPDYENPGTANTDSEGRPVYAVQVTITGATAGVDTLTLAVSLLDDPATDGVIQNLAGDYTLFTLNTPEYIDADPDGDTTGYVVVGNNITDSFASGALTITQMSGAADGSFSFYTANATAGGDDVIGAGEVVATNDSSFTTIGTVDGSADGQNGRPLVIHFNGTATARYVEEILNGLQYTAPTGGVREFYVYVNDGDGNTYGTAESVSFVMAGPTEALAVTVAGSGAVTSSGGEVTCDRDCTRSIGNGLVITLTATADSGFTFTGWSGACSGTGNCAVTMDAAKAVTATFGLGCPTGVAYVDKNASGANTGLSWADAYTDLAQPLQQYRTCGGAFNEIWVARGLYTPGLTVSDTFTIPAGVALYGGFAATETVRTERDWTANVTVLSGDIGGDDTTDATGIITDPVNIVGDNAYQVTLMVSIGITEPITEATRLDGFTITGGSATGLGYNRYGGGLFCHAYAPGSICSPTLANMTFTGNTASIGGGMTAFAERGTSSPVLTDVRFQHNSAVIKSFGGAFVSLGLIGENSPQLTNVTFYSNTAAFGGAWLTAAYSDTISSPALNNVTFEHNAAAIGGAMFNTSYESSVLQPTLTNTHFRNNRSFIDSDFRAALDRTDISSAITDGFGGALVNLGFLGTSHLLLTDSTFENNSAGAGGALTNVALGSVADATLLNTEIRSNQAITGGGLYAMSVAGSINLTFTNVLLHENAAEVQGGALATMSLYGSTNLTLTNTTVSSNTAGTGGAISMLGTGDYAQSNMLQLANSILWGNRAITSSDQISVSQAVTVAIADSLIEGGWNGPGIVTNTATVVDGGGNVAGDPLFADLAAADLRLLSGSPAIDRGDNNALPVGLLTDLLGNPRIFNQVVDMGAYETQGFILTISSGAVQTTAVNLPFATPLQLAVTHSANTPVGAGAVVTFVPPSSGAGLSSSTPFTAVTEADGTATVTVTANSLVGSYVVTATASGVNTPVFFSLHNQSAVSTTLTLTTTPNPVAAGEPLTLTATLSPTAAGGTVQFYVDGAPFGVTQPLTVGVANLVTTTLPAGTYVISATYGGSGAYLPSTAEPVTQTVSVAVNQVPVLTNLAGGNPFTEDGSAVVIDSDVTVSDAELDARNGGNGNYAGATLSIARNDGANAQDYFGHSGQLGALTEGQPLTYNSVTVGTVITNSNGTLGLAFTNTATTAIVTGILQSITYSNTADAPPAAVILDWTFRDGQGGTAIAPDALLFTGATGSANPFAALTLPNGSTPALVDIDNDGDHDLFSGSGDGPLAFYRNTGTATLPAFTAVTGSDDPFDGVTFGSNSRPAFADLDGDGDQDAVIGDVGGAFLYYQNSGTASVPAFAAITGSSNPFDGLGAGGNSAPALVDIDGDGDWDLFSGENNGTLLFYRNTGTANAPAFTAVTGSSNPFDGVDVGILSRPAFADVDGDGDPDALLGDLMSGGLKFYRNTGTATAPSFTEMTGSANPFDGLGVGSNSAPAFADLDGDGDPDAVSGSYDGAVASYRNTTSRLPNARITINATNDDPILGGLPLGITVTQHVTSFVDLSSLTFSDPDAAQNTVTLIISATAGALTASDSGGVTVGGSGTATLYLSGPAADIDTYLNTGSNLTYLTALNATGVATFTLIANDGGNSGTGGGTDVTLGAVTVTILTTPTPTPTSTPTATATSISTPTATNTSIATPTATATGTVEPTNTPTVTPTGTVPTPTTTATATETTMPTATTTGTVAPTNTPTVTPTATATGTPMPTNTATVTPTGTVPTPTTTPTATSTPTGTLVPTNTPTATQTGTVPTPTVTPTGTVPTPTTTATATETAMPTATTTGTVEPTNTPTVTPTGTLPTATATPTATQTGTATVTPTGTVPTATATATATGTPVPTSTATGTPTTTMTPTSTATPTATGTDAPTNTPTATPITTATSTATVMPTATVTPTGTLMPTATPTGTDLPTSTATPTATTTPSVTPTATTMATPTATNTEEPTSTPISTPTETIMPTPTSTATPSVTPTATTMVTPTATNTEEPTSTPTATNTAEPTQTATPTATSTATATAVPTGTVEPTSTPTETIMPTPTSTATPSVTPTATATTMVTPTATSTAEPTSTPTATATNTATPPATNTPVPSPTVTATATSTTTPAPTLTPTASATATATQTPAPGTISGTLFVDRNGNRTQDNGEPGLAGATVTLATTSGPVATVNTDSSGYYQFSNLTPGVYEVQAVAPGTWVAQSATTKSVNLGSGSATIVNFRYQSQGAITGVVFHDLDGSGNQGPGESGVSGATVQLLQNGTLVTSTLSSDDGSYQFSGLMPGNYTVAMVPLTDFVVGTGAQQPVILAADGAVNVNFGLHAVSTIAGLVYIDRNGDGSHQDSETGIGAATVSLFTAGPDGVFRTGDEILVSSTSSAADGSYRFVNQAVGAYAVQLTVPAGYTVTSPSEVVVNLAQFWTAVANFGNQALNTIVATTFEDRNNNGIQDDDEEPLAGLPVFLEPAAQSAEARATISATTNSAGLVTFQDVPAGDYLLRTATPATGYVGQRTLAALTLPPHGVGAAQFGFQQIGTVSGVIFTDGDGNGRRDPGEGGLGGVTVTLSPRNQSAVAEALATTVTAGDGSYHFGALAAGAYQLAVTPPTGYVATRTNPVDATLSATGANAALAVSMGFVATGNVSGRVFADLNKNGVQEMSELGVSGAAITLQGNGQAERMVQTTVDGLFLLSGVVNGVYQATLTLPPNHTATTALVTTITVDTSQAATARFGVRPNLPNQAPQLAALANVAILRGQAVTIQATATDVDDVVLVFSATGLPPGLAIDSATGLISGQLAADATGTYLITITVSDPQGASSQRSFTIEVLLPTGEQPVPEPGFANRLYLPLITR